MADKKKTIVVKQIRPAARRPAVQTATQFLSETEQRNALGASSDLDALTAKSALARSIFPEQLQELYAADTRQRDALKENARRLYQELIDRMASGVLKSDRIEKLTEQLVAKLATHKGKMQYGYLQAPVKAIVDEIVDELARDVDVAEAYRLWVDIRTDILSTYQDEVLEIHDALETLAKVEPRLVQVVEMRYFAGLTEAEVAAALGITDRTVRRDWERARLLLMEMLGR